MESYFSSIGMALANICGDNFDEAKIKADLFETHSSIEYSCERNGIVNEGVESEAKDNFLIFNSLMSIKQEMGDTWNRCVFTLAKDGKFNLEFESVENPLMGEDPSEAFR